MLLKAVWKAIWLLLLLELTLAFPLHNQQQNASDQADLITKLRGTITAVDRTLLLANGGNSSFVFDFLNPPASAVKTAGGVTNVAAKVSTFPALVGSGISLTLVTVGPCGVGAPHIHPRADEFLVVIEGRLLVQSFTEGGSVLITNTLPAFSGVIFNQGAVHGQFNPDCTEAKFFASFNSNDAGTTNVAPSFFLFDDNMILDDLGGTQAGISLEDIQLIRNFGKSGNFAVEECLKKCGLNP